MPGVTAIGNTLPAEIPGGVCDVFQEVFKEVYLLGRRSSSVYEQVIFSPDLANTSL
jgi:hypothetical protein